MKPKRPLHCTGGILTALHIFPLDYLGQTHCIFQEDVIMTQQATRRLKPAVAMATICVIFAVACNLPQVLSLGSECYTITGVDYRGSQNKIELPPYLTDAAELIQSTDCLTWNSSIESRKPRARERGIGPHNNCRNPDGDILPWCKVPGVAGSDGAWGYCHVPKCKVPGYLGCFMDKGQPPALDAVNILHKSTTVGACLTFCRRQGYKYAGLEAGHACYCGNYGYNRYGASSERGTNCASKCFGNRGQPCGGDGYLDVYISNLGSCGTLSPIHDRAGAVYSPGYPDFPASTGLRNSLEAADAMLEKLREKERPRNAQREENSPPTSGDELISSDENCVWNIDVKQATDVRMLIRKIDPKRKLGGVIEIEAGEGEKVVISIPAKLNSSRTASPLATTDTHVRTSLIWIGDSLSDRNEIDVILPHDVTDDETQREFKHEWSDEIVKRKNRRYVLPSTLDSVVSVTGGRLTVRFLRSPDMVTSLKSALDHERHRSRSRKKASVSEWSRFIVEFEATLPEGATVEPVDDGLYDVTRGTRNGGESGSRRNKPKHRGNKNRNDPEYPDSGSRDRARNSFKAEVSKDELGNTRFTISQEDARAIKEAMTSAGEETDSESGKGPNSPIKIKVFVEPIAKDPTEETGEEGNKQPMSEFTVPLLLAVLLTTTAILILSAILVIFRRGGITMKKQEKQHDIVGGLVVACHPSDGGRGLKKSSSDSNLSSSSTADSLLLTDSDNSKYSPRLRDRDNSSSVSPAAIKNLMEILKGHPGILQNRPPLDSDQYKQVPQHAPFLPPNPEVRNDLRPDDVAHLPGPCPYCCGCAENNRTHRHGDSCRSHHNQGKHGKSSSSSSRPSGSKNTRGLSIRGCNRAISTAQQPIMSLAPPLSPISERSVASSMMSLPITSSNSQTSLLSRHSPPGQSAKNTRSLARKDGEVGSESEAFLAGGSDAESGVGDMTPVGATSSSLQMNRVTKLRFSDNVSETLVPSRYLGGVAGACYDSGYATSNYEEEEEKLMKDNENYLSLAKSEIAEGDSLLDRETKLDMMAP